MNQPGGDWRRLSALILLVVPIVHCRRAAVVGEAPADTRTPLAAEVASTDSLAIDEGSFFLLRRLSSDAGAPLELAAVRIARTVPSGMEFECYYQGNGTGDLSSVPMKKGTVTERVDAGPRTGIYSTAGSVLDIVCGTFKVQWSVGNWIYLHDSAYFSDDKRPPPDFDLADPGKRRLEQIDVYDRRLRWLTFRGAIKR
jgi:hypothetical protein